MVTVICIMLCQQAKNTFTLAGYNIVQLIENHYPEHLLL